MITQPCNVQTPQIFAWADEALRSESYRQQTILFYFLFLRDQEAQQLLPELYRQGGNHI